MASCYSTDTEGEEAEHPRVPFALFQPLTGEPEADMAVPSLEPEDNQDDDFLVIDDTEDLSIRYQDMNKRRHRSMFEEIEDDPDTIGIRPILPCDQWFERLRNYPHNALSPITMSLYKAKNSDRLLYRQVTPRDTLARYELYEVPHMTPGVSCLFGCPIGRRGQLTSIGHWRAKHQALRLTFNFPVRDNEGRSCMKTIGRDCNRILYKVHPNFFLSWVIKHMTNRNVVVFVIGDYRLRW